MDGFVIVPCFLLIITQVQCRLHKFTWRANVRGFANDTRSKIRNIYEKNSLCSGLGEHIVTTEEKNVLYEFGKCDNDKPILGDEGYFNCYFDHEGDFHKMVDAASKPEFCNPKNMCSILEFEIKRMKKRIDSSQTSCFHFNSQKTLIEILSMCQFIEPILEKITSLTKKILTMGISCVQAEEQMNEFYRSIHRAREYFVDCKEEISQNMNSMIDNCKYNGKPNCCSSTSFNSTIEIVKRCYDLPSKNLKKLEEAIEQEMKNCNANDIQKDT